MPSWNPEHHARGTMRSAKSSTSEPEPGHPRCSGGHRLVRFIRRSTTDATILLQRQPAPVLDGEVWSTATVNSREPAECYDGSPKNQLGLESERPRQAVSSYPQPQERPGIQTTKRSKRVASVIKHRRGCVERNPAVIVCCPGRARYRATAPARQRCLAATAANLWKSAPPASRCPLLTSGGRQLYYGAGALYCVTPGRGTYDAPLAARCRL